ncbi:MAG: ThiF family adenylyltransferase [bacterium]|nr:ThiF family adenylyltransferase [bacterium]
MRRFINWLTPKREGYRVYQTKALKGSANAGEVFDRQSGIPGFSQEKLSASRIILVGAGGLGSEIGEGLVRKGAGLIKIFDPDVVEPSNLNRQLFFEKDLYKNKAISLAKNLSQMGFGKTKLMAYPYSFEDAFTRNDDLTCSLAIVGVDNNLCRVSAAKYYYEKRIPVIFTAVSEDGNAGYVFVQESRADKSCFGCLKPEAIKEVESGTHRFPCPGTPAIKDILKTVAGLVIFAVDTLLMERHSEWNNRVIYLDGSVPSGSAIIRRKENCPLCGSRK